MNSVTISVKRKTQVEEKTEIPVPSFWKGKWTGFFWFAENGKVFSVYPTGSHLTEIENSIQAQEFPDLIPSTKEEWDAAYKELQRNNLRQLQNL